MSARPAAFTAALRRKADRPQSKAAPRLRLHRVEIGLLQRNPALKKAPRHFLTVARQNPPTLQFRRERQADGDIVHRRKGGMQAVAALDDGKRRRCDGHGRQERQAVAVKAAEGDGLTLPKRREHLFKQALLVQIAARLGKARGRALFGAQKKSSAWNTGQSYRRASRAASVVLPLPQGPSMASTVRFPCARRASISGRSGRSGAYAALTSRYAGA